MEKDLITFNFSFFDDNNTFVSDYFIKESSFKRAKENLLNSEGINIFSCLDSEGKTYTEEGIFK
jgi:hypothetical protein